MKYILRTLWLIGYIPVFIFVGIVFLIMILVYPLVLIFYFIKTGSTNCLFTPDFTPDFIPVDILDKKYRELLKYLR